MKLNKKGFTLIELLAVIVVLAIILVIAVPKVLDVINTARSEALGKSAQVAVSSLEKEYMLKMSMGEEWSTSGSCSAVIKFEASEGTCNYTTTTEGVEPVFTVTIIGAGKFDGWTATSSSPASSTVTKTNPK